MKKVSCILEKMTKNGQHLYCHGCGNDLPAAEHWGFPYVISDRWGNKRITLFAGCAACINIDRAMAEANDLSLRYTEISVQSNDDALNGSRCPCGAVRLLNLGMCVSCSRISRMLDKASGEARLVNKLLKELRTEVKTKQRELADQQT